MTAEPVYLSKDTNHKVKSKKSMKDLFDKNTIALFGLLSLTTLLSSIM